VRVDPRSLFVTFALLPACTSAGGGVPDAASDMAHSRDAEPEASPVCPTSPPTPDASCALPASFECSFGDPCSFDRFECQDGAWAEVIKDGAAPETCPDAAPPTGSTCASCGKSFRCTYEAPCDDDGQMMTTSICAGGHWLTGTLACEAGGG
jgi:hypothetical protein